MFNKPEKHQTLEIFDRYPRRRRPTPQILKCKLREVIFGKRQALHVYSQALKTDIWFVNEGLVNPADKAFSGRVITMANLAEVLAGDSPLTHLAKGLTGR